jgi:hypothetical protein
MTDDKKLYLVETISFFRNRFVVLAKKEEDALDEVAFNTGNVYNEEWREFSQKHIDENIISYREITREEYLKLYDKDNDYLTHWSDDQKLKSINVINYEE